MMIFITLTTTTMTTTTTIMTTSNMNTKINTKTNTINNNNNNNNNMMMISKLPRSMNPLMIGRFGKCLCCKDRCIMVDLRQLCANCTDKPDYDPNMIAQKYATDDYDDDDDDRYDMLYQSCQQSFVMSYDLYKDQQKDVKYIPYKGDELERFAKVYTKEEKKEHLQLFKEENRNNRGLGRALYLRCKNPDTKNPCKRILENYQYDCEIILLAVIPFSLCLYMDNLQSQLKKEYPEWKKSLCVHDVWVTLDDDNNDDEFKISKKVEYGHLYDYEL